MHCQVWFILCLAGACQVKAGLGENWEWRNPLPQGATLHAVAQSGGRLIAVGRAGTILTTTDAMTWKPQESGTRSFLQAVASFGSTVVAVGREGDIVTSTDSGLTWTLRSSSAADWRTVIHGGNLWVAGGISTAFPASSAVMTSPDGLTWTAHVVPGVPDLGGTAFHCAAWTGTRFILGGSNYPNGGNAGLASSEDGITWTQSFPALMNITGMVWTGSRLAATGTGTNGQSGHILVSADGLTWTEATIPFATYPFGGVVWTGTQLFVWSWYSPQIYTSPDGDTWTPGVANTNPPGFYYTGAATGTGSLLLQGTTQGVMLRSADSGTTWDAVPSGVAGNCKALTRFAERWVSVGTEGSLTSSADGLAWTPASSGTISRLRAIAWHGGLWVAGGREDYAPAGLPDARTFSLFTSIDGVTWTDRSFDNAAVQSRRQIYSIIRAGTRWVAAAREAVLTSADAITWQTHVVGWENRAVAWNGSRLIVAGGVEDEDGGNAEGWVHLSDDGGVTWSNQTLGTSFLRGVSWTGSQFVAVGNDGRIFTSLAGTAGTWTERGSGTSRDLRCVMTDAGGLVAAGGNYSAGPVILTSPDGVTWTTRAVPGTQVLYSVIKAGPLYVATGYDGAVLTSPDAVNWTSRRTNTTHELYAAAWDGRQLLVSGEGGAILASGGTFIEWKRVNRGPGPSLTLTFSWPTVTGRIYDIESSTTMAQPWLPIPGSPRTATGPETTWGFTEPVPATAKRRFFRVQERP